VQFLKLNELCYGLERIWILAYVGDRVRNINPSEFFFTRIYETLGPSMKIINMHAIL
jgi:hypothetical protein